MPTIIDKSVLITGANRGIGRALVEEALQQGAKRVYAGTRQPLAHRDARVTPVPLDVTDPAHLRRAVEHIDSLDLLVNNAAAGSYDDLGDRAEIEKVMAVNLYGTHAVTRAFLPTLLKSRGAIVNILSLAAIAPVPVTPAYSISKAATLSLSIAQRMLLREQGVTVHIVFPGPVDTDMSRDIDVPKATPEAVARAILTGVANGDEEIFPDPMSEAIAQTWQSGVTKQLEPQFAELLTESPRVAEAR
ncbi:SDR family NAD(P)-dependent oxidoreductase [Nocardia sp. CA-135398]|uniref:SDR family NAD(P)-dependent oxidoreductase n=1 Tax=Nocardia sp. CA-135398 TaxID=3239977 RepID=UPI003D97DE10